MFFNQKYKKDILSEVNKKYIGNLRKIFNSLTFRETSWIFIATTLNGVLGLVFYIFLARVLGPSDFGLFSLSIVILALVADIGNLGINTGIVNFVSKYQGVDKQKSEKFLKLALISKLVLGFFVFIFGYLISSGVSNYLFLKPKLLFPLRIVFFGIGTTWLFSFSTSYYQAYQRFYSLGLIQVFTNLLRLLGVLVYHFKWGVDLNTSLIIFVLSPLIGFILSMVNIKFSFLKEKIEKSLLKEFFGYNRWIAVSSGIGAFTSRADTFILGRMVSSAGLGIYAAANQLVSIIPQLTSSIGTVVAPKFASFDNDKKMLIYLKKLFTMVLSISFFIVLTMPLARILIDIFFGEKYVKSFPVFVVLLLAALIFFISVPIHNAIIYFYSYPKLFSYLSLVNLLIILPLMYLSVMKFGIFGPAYCILFINTIGLILPSIWLVKRIRLK